MTDDAVFQRFMERYASGDIPWDDGLPPPEVVALATGLPPGRALDLGCGYGRAAIFLAKSGWQVDGVDFVPLAVAEAQKRARQAGVADRVHFHQASVTALGFLPGHYQLAVDVGCLHALDGPAQRAYRDELHRLLEPGAAYLLFARLVEEVPLEEGPASGEGPRGMAEAAIGPLFADGFVLEKSAIGLTHVGEKSWKSGWFWFTRG